MQYIDESLLLKLELSTVRGWMQRPPIDEVYPSSKLLLLFMTLSNCITASKIVVLMPSGTFQATTREIIASSVCCLGNICTYKMENGFLFSFSFFLQFHVRHFLRLVKKDNLMLLNWCWITNSRLLVSILLKINLWKSGSGKSKTSKMAQNDHKI